MPIHLNSDGGDDHPPVDPDTNAYRLLQVLLEHPEMEFSPRELAELADVPHASIHETLSRMRERGLVRKIDSYWAVVDDIAASHVASVVSLDTIEETHGDDAYAAMTRWQTTFRIWVRTSSDGCRVSSNSSRTVLFRSNRETQRLSLAGGLATISPQPP